MDQLWGLTGAQFLRAYAAAIVASMLLAGIMRAVLRRGPTADPLPAEDVYTLAVVGGGARRVVETAAYALVEIGQLQTRHDRRLTVCGDVAYEPVQQMVLDYLRADGGRATLKKLRRTAATLEPVRQVSASAVRRGLLLSPGRLRAARATLLVPLAVFGTGVIALADGIHDGTRVDALALALCCTAFALAVTAATLHLRTRAGQRMLRQARSQYGHTAGRQVYASYGAEAMFVSTRVLGVAALGPAGVADSKLRETLYGRAPSYP